MSQVFVRSDKLADKIYEVRLPVPEWKVLFALDGKMNASQLSDFLEFEENEVSTMLDHLKEIELAAPADVKAPQPEKPAEEIESEEAKAAAPEQSSEEEPQPEEEPQERPATEEEAEEEVVEEKFTFEPAEEEFEHEDAGEGFGAPTEEEKSEQDEKGEEDLDQLIDDLLKEESQAGRDEEEKEGDEIPGAREMVELNEKEKEVTEKETESDTEEKEDFDLGEIFQTDLKETEESLDEMLETEEKEEEKPEEGEVPAPPKEPEVKTILVVDDSVVIRKMVEIALENESYKIVTVASGKEALTFLDENETNVVILDIMLPDVNGLEILKAIKASKDIPVIMLSAKDTPRDTGKAKELGADDFIPKPFKDEELIGKIHELIGE